MKEVQLTRGMKALVDDEDFELVTRHRWHPKPGGKTFYADTSIRGSDGKWHTAKMHRLILGLSDSDPRRGDHVDMNGLNNQRHNLRVVDATGSNVNRLVYGKSGFKGVFKRKGGFVAGISLRKKGIYLGWFKRAEEAAHAYDDAARRFYGELARLNFPRETEQSALVRKA